MIPKKYGRILNINNFHHSNVFCKYLKESAN